MKHVFAIFFVCLLAPGINNIKAQGADSLYAWYAFEESGIDSMGNVDLGMVDVNVVWDSLKGYVAEVVKDSAGYMYAMSPMMPETQDEYTVSCWYFYENTQGDWKQIFEFNNTKSGHPMEGRYIYMSPNLWGLNYGIIFYGDAWDWVCREPRLPDLGWHHLAVTQKDKDITVYLDGEIFMDGSVQNTPSEVAVDTFFFLNGGGGDLARNFPHDGKMDDLKFFHRALDAATIKIISEENKPLKVIDKATMYSEASVWFPLDGNGNDSIGDNMLDLKDISFERVPERGGTVAVMHHLDTAYMLAQQPMVTEDVFTFSTWFYWDSEYEEWWQEIFEWDNADGTSHFYLSPRAGSNYGLVTNPPWTAITDVNPLPADKWVHLAFTYNEGDVVGYLDGAQAFAGRTESLLSEMDLVKFYFGTSMEAGRIYRTISGKYDDIALWKEILTTEQIYAIANDTSPVRPDVDPYVFELEDYTFGSWSTGTDGDTGYGFWNGSMPETAMEEESILYGYATGGGVFSLWAHMNLEADAASPFHVKVGGMDAYTALDSVHATSGWQWVNLYKSPALPPGMQTIHIAPGTPGIRVDKFIFTSDWGFDPDSEYEKTDLEAPGDPGELTVSKVDAKSATIAWAASTDNVAVSSYDIYDGDRIIAVSDVEATKLRLLSSGTYTISVRAKDRQGNVSGRNSAKEVRTEDLSFTVRFDEPRQVIHHIGASDGEATHWLARWPEAKRDSMAMLLFSQELYPDGSPKGIGLSNWRYHIGDGSIYMDNSGFHSGAWLQETPCFLNADGSYDFSSQPGSDWFRDKAQEAGVEYLTGWATSPPYHMTKNGFSFRHDTTEGYNLAAGKYDDFADFLARVARHFQDNGTPFEVVSPINEPQWSWAFSNGNAIQSGSSASNSDIATLAKAIDAKFTEFGVHSKILIPEAGALNMLHSMVAGYNTNSDQVNAFWNPSSPDYIGDLPNMSNYVAGHSYWSNQDVPTTVNHRRKLLDKLNSLDSSLSFWQTEFSILSADYLEGRDHLRPIEYSLWATRIIHIDLTEGNATGWDWWTSFANAIYQTHEYRFGLMNFYPDPDDPSHTDGSFWVTRTLWTLGNYSRFVRPGSRRLNVDRSDGASMVGAAGEQFLSAYLSKDSTHLIVVAINYNKNPQNISIDLSTLPSHLTADMLSPFVTSGTENLKAYAPIEAGSPFRMPGFSVVTLVGELTNSTSARNAEKIKLPKENSLKLYPNPAKDLVHIEFSGERAESIGLIDMTGKLILSRKPLSGRVSLDCAGLKRGIYIISADYGHRKEFMKLSLIE